MLGEALRKQRLKVKMTQEELGFAARISRNYVSELENDLKSPTLETLFRICEALGISTSRLIARVERKRPKK